MSILNTKARRAGIEKRIKIKSNLFQLYSKYLILCSLSFIINSIKNKIESKLSSIEITTFLLSPKSKPPIKIITAFRIIKNRITLSLSNSLFKIN
jgi:hypothetical protein